MRLLFWGLLVISITLLSTTKAASLDEKKAVLDSDNGILSHVFAEHKEKRYLRVEIKKTVSEDVGKYDADEEARVTSVGFWDKLKIKWYSRRFEKWFVQGKVTDLDSAEKKFKAGLGKPFLPKNEKALDLWKMWYNKREASGRTCIGKINCKKGSETYLFLTPTKRS